MQFSETMTFGKDHDKTYLEGWITYESIYCYFAEVNEHKIQLLSTKTKTISFARFNAPPKQIWLH
jgi:hypothetical protein